MISNFTVHDILGSLLAILFFPIVLLIPGYLLGWSLNLFDFRQRRHLVQYCMSMVLSNAVIPIYAYLLGRFVSVNFVLATLILYTLIFILLEGRPLFQRKKATSFIPPIELERYQKAILLSAAIWVLFSVLLLVDLQFSDRLYFPATSYDYTTRVAVIEAITRTGIPPVNPTYFPGQPERLTFLYYYWYILPSLVDKIGGAWITARQALIAGVTWGAFSLAALIAIYTRLRNSFAGKSAWKAAIIGTQLLLITGLDFFPVVFLSLASRFTIGRILFPDGRLEGWNMPIMSWLNAITWVPNHVAAMLSCFTATLVLLWSLQRTDRERFLAALVAGLAIASAFGTSVWIALTLALIWVIWGFVLLLSQDGRKMIPYMFLAGLIAIGLSLPFIKGLMGSAGASSGGGLPIAFSVRTFTIDAFLPLNSNVAKSIVNTLFLPVNYFMELGFFFVIGIYWLRHRNHAERQDHHFLVAEIITLATIAILLAFVRSDIIDINDLGIRAWLLGQFVLLIWATDVIYRWLGNDGPRLSAVSKVMAKQPRIGGLLQFLWIAGLLMTGLEAFTTRSWAMLIDSNVVGFPNSLSLDTNLGRRTYAARLAYEYINQNLPPDVITQNNPTVILDRPSGLYGERQMVIADRTAYGVSMEVFKSLQKEVGLPFNTEHLNWSEIDSVCQKKKIDVLIMKDTDPLWKNLAALTQKRSPLYKNEFYAVFACGNFSAP